MPQPKTKPHTIGSLCIFQKSGSIVQIDSEHNFDRTYGDYFYTVSRLDTKKEIWCSHRSLIPEIQWKAEYDEDYKIRGPENQALLDAF